MNATTDVRPVASKRRRSGLAEVVRRRWSALAPIAVLCALLIGFGLVADDFLTRDNALNILRGSAVLLVLALASMTVILTGGIDLSIGSTMMLAAFVGALLAKDAGSTDILLILPIVGLACGVVNGAVVAYGRLPSFLVTLGTYFTFAGLARYLADGQPVTLPYQGAGSIFTGNALGFPAIVTWSLGTLVIAILVFRYTRVGRHIYAIGGNEKTARLSGVAVRRVKLYAFMGAGLLAGFAAILLLMRTGSASPNMGEPFLLPAIAAVVMGGTPLSGGAGGPLNVVLGVLVISILNNGMVLAAVNPHIQNVVMGLVVVIAVALTIDRRRNDVVK